MVKYEEIKEDTFDIWLVNGDNSIQNVFLKGAEVSAIAMPTNPGVRLLRIKDAFGRCFLLSEARWFWSWRDANLSLKVQGGVWDNPTIKPQVELDKPSD